MLPANVIESVSEGYDKLWQSFIKPEKTSYSTSDLGPPVRQ